MSPNPAVSTLVGVLAVGAAVASIWAVIFVLEATFSAIGDSMKYLIGVPMVLFVAYLVGNGVLELRSEKPR